MATPFETFVNTELPTRVSTAIPTGGNLASEKLIRTTGVGLAVQLTDTIRAGSVTDIGSLIVNSTLYDQFAITALSQALRIVNPTGTPFDGQRLTIRIKSAAVQTITYDTAFRGSTDLPLTATTTGNAKTDYIAFVWNTADSTWDYIARNAGF